MSRKASYPTRIFRLLESLHKKYPNQPITMHIAMATSDYNSIDGIPDKEFVHLLEKYQCERELDIAIPGQEEIYSDFSLDVPEEDEDDLFLD